MPDESTQQGSDKTVVVDMVLNLTSWKPKLEREFRKLTLEEAKGTISAEQAVRLNELERWRNRLLNPQSAEEILLQIKRDSILDKMEALLREYVQSKESTGQKRATT